jgi:hypothetical protein
MNKDTREENKSETGIGINQKPVLFLPYRNCGSGSVI